MSPTDSNKISKVVVHPLVLLSVVDHFNRMGKVGNVKRVVGVLLGANRGGILDVSNSFAGKCHCSCGFVVSYNFGACVHEFAGVKRPFFPPVLFSFFFSYRPDE